MKNFKQKYLMVALMIVLSLALVGFTGCSKAPTGIEEDDIGEVKLLKRNVALAKLFEDSYYIEQKVSAAEGGSVNLYDVELYFPPGALNNDTLISIEIPDPSLYADHFGTDGLVFNVPVRITMSYRDAIIDNVDESTIKMAWFNEQTGQWDIIRCFCDPVTQTVTAHVSHFSAYALITDE